MQGGATSNELQRVSGYADRPRSFELRLNRLLHDGLLEMTVPRKPISPVQEYRLTDTGRVALEGAASATRSPTGETRTRSTHRPGS